MKRAIVALVAIATIGLAGCNSSSGADDMKFQAFDVCKTFVKNDLKSPSTAKFRNFYQDDGEVTIVTTPEGHYLVDSTVDSQNGFGAMVRTRFQCEVQHTSGRNWQRVAVDFLE